MEKVKLPLKIKASRLFVLSLFMLSAILAGCGDYGSFPADRKVQDTRFAKKENKAATHDAARVSRDARANIQTAQENVVFLFAVGILCLLIMEPLRRYSAQEKPQNDHSSKTD
jgi:predicted small lipoprotein YifL